MCVIMCYGGWYRVLSCVMKGDEFCDCRLNLCF